MTYIGVLGAGTMGTGIAQVAAAAGFEVVLYDVSMVQLDRAVATARGHLQRSVEKGRLSAAEAEATMGRLRTITTLGSISHCDVIIEAAPEDLTLKKQIFAELDKVCKPEAILATNTSSLSVTEVGALAAHPARVVGMHFFNPAPVLALVEIVVGKQTAPETLEHAVELARRLGKTPVVVQDTPGFIVNRCARPFYLEALRLIGEGVASPEAIDRICRLGGGFKMGPCELMDLVGLDVNFAVSQSVHAQFFGDPRYRPSPVQQRMVQAGMLGRKTGRGFYSYENGRGPQPEPPADAAALSAAGRAVLGGRSRALVLGEGPLVAQVVAAGLTVQVGSATDPRAAAAAAADTHVVVEASGLAAAPRGELLAAVGAVLRSDALLLCDVSDAPATLLATWAKRPVGGFGALAVKTPGALIEVTTSLGAPAALLAQTEGFWHALGRPTQAVKDSPGLVLARILSSLVNEACTALQEGIATPEDIDTAMVLGVNYPRGPLAWGEEIGLGRVLTCLETLQAEFGDDRYRPSFRLRQLLRANQSFFAS